MKLYYKTYNTNIGTLSIVATDDSVTKIVFGTYNLDNTNIVNEENKIIQQAFSELTEYLDGKRKSFGVKINLDSLSEFQQAVLRETLLIPYGKSISYGDIAKKINKGCARAVGTALRKNPVPILIPCHRVIGKNNPFAYNGGEKTKKRLMSLECIDIKNL